MKSTQGIAGWGAAVAALLALSAVREADAQSAAPRLKLGAYYFAGWSGKSSYDDGSVSNAWAKGMPTHFTRKLGTDFAGRTPVWGWREDASGITERQIDLAADHGLAFFAYCWYFKDSKGPINVEKIEQHPLHEPMKKFMAAKNNTRMEFCLLVANHKGSEITGAEAWKQAADYWLKNYFGHPRYLRMDGKPLVIIFSPKGSDKAGLAYLQEAARKAGFPGVWVAGCGNVKAEDGYQLVTAYNTRPVKDAEGKALDLETSYPFKLLADWNVAAWNSTNQAVLPRIPLVTQGWDCRPWQAKVKEGGRGSPPTPHFARGTPEEFEAYLRRMPEWMDANPERTTRDRLGLIYAWNEIGEGGWLVPCRDDPDGAYLKAIRRVVYGK